MRNSSRSRGSSYAPCLTEQEGTIKRGIARIVDREWKPQALTDSIGSGVGRDASHLPCPRLRTSVTLSTERRRS